MVERKSHVCWFRNGLRLHDNPALIEAIEGIDNESTSFIPLFIFDGSSVGTDTIGYNRMSYLLECLKTLDDQFKQFGGSLVIAKGSPVQVLEEIHSKNPIQKLTWEQDPENKGKKRDKIVQEFCLKKDIEVVEKLGHTLFDPWSIIEANGGTAPTTFNIFNYIIFGLGPPDRPVPDADLSGINFLDVNYECSYSVFPKPEDFDINPNPDFQDTKKVYFGGEVNALEHLQVRMAKEVEHFKKGYYLPNRRAPDILFPPRSLSPDLKFGCLSVRKFYWSLLDSYEEWQKINGINLKLNQNVVAPLIWREFFYTMAANNPYYAEIQRNPICFPIPWNNTKNNKEFDAFLQAKTGFPFIDAGLRQLYTQGWIHHIVRNAITCFLTRGDLWISWEEGLKLFLKYLLDADEAICAGNWMWISSSAFEEAFNCQNCIDPGTFGRRHDPHGEYIKRFIPELRAMPVEYIYEPWKAPIEVQKNVKCMIGENYPNRIVDHQQMSKINCMRMKKLHRDFLHICRNSESLKKYIHPTDSNETRQFMVFENECPVCISNKCI